MSTELNVTQPVSAWNRKVSVDFQAIFSSLAKSAAKFAVGRLDEMVDDAVEVFGAVKLEDLSCEQKAWLLIQRAIHRALFDLIEGNRDLFTHQEMGEEQHAALYAELDQFEVTINRHFFERPADLALLQKIQPLFAGWLQAIGLSQQFSQNIAARLPSYFVVALNAEWRKRPQDYLCLQEQLDTPFTNATEVVAGWRNYRAWLIKQVDLPMFGETFGLKQVYVPLRAYFYDKNNHKSVVELHENIRVWLNASTIKTEIRLISGGPGTGKSSFAKMLAAELARAEKMVLLIPLHQFDLSGNLVDSIAKFVEYNEFLVENPLQPKNPNLQLFIIFDGLDEFAMQGKAALESAQQFVREVQKTVERFKQLRLQVLITGRDVVIQANQSEFREPEQILHVLPYFYESSYSYEIPNDSLEQDQRDTWWRQYGQARGKEYQGLPKELDRRQLREMTAQPLLNYLVALSYERGKVNFSQDTNLNEVYADLLSAVHERGWEKRSHEATKGLTCQQFERILEEIAVAAWHGDGRTTTIQAIATHCEQSGLRKLLDSYQKDAEQGLTKLLTAFYFRQAEQLSRDGDKTFEFTHKSFAEYLTARRIINQVAKIHTQLQQYPIDPEAGWHEEEALRRWAMLCGMTAMDRYVFEFVCSEVQLRNKESVNEWQRILSDLIGYMLRHGMPMHKLQLPTYKETCRQARNAEEALLAALNACARVTQQRSNIEWKSKTAFGEWVSRLQPQRSGGENTLTFSCFSYLKLSSCYLDLRDFYAANFKRAYLVGANLERANLRGANLERAYLEEANLGGANLMGAYLREANLEEAYLEEANLERANLVGANLVGTNLVGANLRGANLRGANLKNATIEGVRNIETADLLGANLKGTVLEDWHKEKYKQK